MKRATAIDNLGARIVEALEKSWEAWATRHVDELVEKLAGGGHAG